MRRQRGEYWVTLPSLVSFVTGRGHEQLVCCGLTGRCHIEVMLTKVMPVTYVD